MRTLTQTSVFLIFLFLFFSFSYAQQDQDYERWLKNHLNNFGKFKYKQDSLFVEFLKKEWREYKLFSGLVPDEKPKPVNIPVTTPKDIPEDMIPEPSKTIKEIQVPMPPLIKESESIERLISKFLKDEEQLSFSFFDASLKVNYDKAMSEANLENPINEENISNYWADLSRSSYEDLLDQSEKLKQQMKLNDWGYCLLLNKIGKGLYPGLENKCNLFIWFMLSKSGYEAKVGYDDNEVFLLLPSKHVIYGVPYFTMGGKKYYVVTFDTIRTKAKSIYTYEGSYPDARELIALNIENSPVIGQVMTDKMLKFHYRDEEFTVSLKLKRDVIDFYENYPQTDYEVYFDASLSPEARYSLLHNLKPIIEGKSEVEATNILLRFVQTAFEYKNDVEWFRREKPFFAEETLFYPHSDCEDRSVLFAYLVRNLLGLEVIGLDYPGHIATAVKFSTDIKGDYIEFDGKKYIICDATYINANIGQCIPRYKDLKPKIITIGNNY